MRKTVTIGTVALIVSLSPALLAQTAKPLTTLRSQKEPDTREPSSTTPGRIVPSRSKVLYKADHRSLLACVIFTLDQMKTYEAAGIAR